jgi:hypothetical protein
MTKQGFDKHLHKRILLQLLTGIFKELNGKLAFKGGTCAYLFYKLPRISIDLDFDILKSLSDEDIDKIKKILNDLGTLEDFYNKKNTVFFLLNYKSGFPNIKVELNKRVWKNNSYKTTWFLGVAMKIADETTIFTNKIVALTDRKRPVARDFFDIYYFLKMDYSLNEDLIKERTSKNKKEYLTFLINYINKNFNRKNLLLGLGELLEVKQKEWVKKNLFKETIELIKNVKEKKY